ncbi:MAG: FtsW/RodA/SpoVE family cell cycle protein [Planctomycetota bacterium]|nr:MAG: FtsW/RodA/SpoVE family cell cycle protein [Planctomycetota bacterium]
MTLGLPVPTWRGWGLLLPVIPLSLLGVITIQAVSGLDHTGGLTADVKKQIVYILVSLGVMAVAIRIGYYRLGRWSYPLFILCLVLLVLLAFGRWLPEWLTPEIRRSRRWIRIGPLIRIQPSELMKIAYILALAWYLRFRSNYRTFRGLVAPFTLTLIPMGLILSQPDLGTVLLFLPILFVMLYAAGAKGKHLAVIIMMGIFCLPLFWLKIESYQRLRLAGVVLQNDGLREYLRKPPKYLKNRPTRWDCFRPSDTDVADWQSELDEWTVRKGFQLMRSKAAVGSGGLTGRGWVKNIFVKYELLPEMHNDFIFAVISCQWGFLGVLIVILCYVAIVTIGFDLATMTNDPFGRLVAVGLSTLIGVQALINLCMTVGLGPITGVTLPFVSQGGSSMLSSLLSIGLLISVARRRPIIIANHPFEFDGEA